MLPNIAPALIVQATIQFAIAILAEAALSYLGLGAQPPLASWGRMLSDAQNWMYVAPRLAVFPGLAVALSVLGLNLLGDGLRDALDPKLQGAKLTCCSTVADLAIDLPTPDGPRRVVHDVSFTLDGGDSLGRRRRIRLRQDDDRAGADGPAAGRRDGLRRLAVRGPRPRSSSTRRRCRSCAATASAWSSRSR